MRFGDWLRHLFSVRRPATETVRFLDVSDIYQVIVECLIASPDTIWRVLKLQALSQAEAEEVVNRVYGGR